MELDYLFRKHDVALKNFQKCAKISCEFPGPNVACNGGFLLAPLKIVGSELGFCQGAPPSYLILYNFLNKKNLTLRFSWGYLVPNSNHSTLTKASLVEVNSPEKIAIKSRFILTKPILFT